jgi:hypothetical protein
MTGLDFAKTAVSGSERSKPNQTSTLSKRHRFRFESDGTLKSLNLGVVLSKASAAFRDCALILRRKARRLHDRMPPLEF